MRHLILIICLAGYFNSFSQFTVTVTSTNVSCFGGKNGSATVSPTGGVLPYTYLWLPSGQTNPTATNLISATYVVTVTDSLGVSVMDSVTITAPPLITTLITSTNESCIGSNDGTASVTPAGGTPPFSYLWNDPLSQKTIKAVNLVPGVYYVTVIDTNGCRDSIDVTIESPMPVITGNTPDVTICYGDSVNLMATATGGVGGYLYFWEPNNVITNPLNVSPTVTTSYRVHAFDQNGCLGTIDTVVVNVDSLFQSTSNVISGTIYYQGIPITSGEVRLISKTGNSPQTMVDVDSMMVNIDGTYLFDGVSTGNYLIKAKGDTALYDNVATYADSTNHWQNATQYVIGAICKDTVTGADVHLIDFPATIGFGSITGKVKNSTNNYPFPNVDISLEQLPLGIVTGGNMTDANGNFKIENIESGNYMLNIDIAGYVMDTITSFGFIAKAQNNMSYNVEVCVDVNNDTITYCSVNVTHIEDVGLNTKFIVYPNPARDYVIIENTYSTNFRVKVLNVLGMVVYQSETLTNKNSINTSKFDAGIYQVQLVSEGKNYYKKLLIK